MPNYLIEIGKPKKDTEDRLIKYPQYISILANGPADANRQVARYLESNPTSKVLVYKESIRYTPATHIAETIDGEKEFHDSY